MTFGILGSLKKGVEVGRKYIFCFPIFFFHDSCRGWGPLLLGRQCQIICLLSCRGWSILSLLLQRYLTDITKQIIPVSHPPICVSAPFHVFHLSLGGQKLNTVLFNFPYFACTLDLTILFALLALLVYIYKEQDSFFYLFSLPCSHLLMW